MTSVESPTRHPPARPVLTADPQARWRPALFELVPVGALRRRPTDIVRVGVAVALVISAAALTDALVDTQLWTYEAVTSLPGHLSWLFSVLYVGGLVGAVVAVAIAALLGRRTRLVVAIVVAGLVAAASAMGLDAGVGSANIDALEAAGADIGGAQPSFPPLLVAVAVAILAVASPHLSRPARQMVALVVVLGSIGAVAIAAGLPLAVGVGVLLGWGVAAAVHLALGSPAGTPSPTHIASALRDFGIEPAEVTADHEEGWGESRFVVRTGTGDELRVLAIGRDASDAQLISRSWRLLWYRDSGTTLVLTRAQQVERQAFLLFLAEHAGMSVPEIVAVGIAGRADSALLVTQEPVGQRWTDIGAHRLTDAVLDDAWRGLGSLHQARLAHGNVLASNLLLLPDETVAYRDLSRASSSASTFRRRVDAAQLLVATAGLVGVDRALAAVNRALGPEELTAVLPMLQSSVLSRRARAEVDQPKDLVAQLRASGAELTATEVPELAQLQRVAPASILMAVGAALGVYLLIGQLSSVASAGEVFGGAEWGWILAALVLSQLPQLTSAWAMTGSVAINLPYGPTVGVQFANNFTGLVGGTVATTALVVRYFQKQGQGVAVAVSSGVLNSLAAMLVQAGLVGIGLVFTASAFEATSSDSSSAGGSDGRFVVLALVVAVMVVGVVLVVPRWRARVRAALGPQVQVAGENLRELARNPHKAVPLFAGNAASQLLFALTLGASLHAYDGSLPILQLVVINSLASVLGGVVPVPGGLGVVEAGLIGGLTAAGVPQTTAVAATFTHRLLTCYLPPIWGWLALQWLRRHDYV